MQGDANQADKVHPGKLNLPYTDFARLLQLSPHLAYVAKSKTLNVDKCVDRRLYSVI